MGDRSKGLIGKFTVTRNDGTSEPGRKHHDCAYFVLDLTHDVHAKPALIAYAGSARKDGYGPLADDLERIAASLGESGYFDNAGAALASAKINVAGDRATTGAPTPEWCVEAFYRVNPGANKITVPAMPSLYLLDFAREVLRAFASPSVAPAPKKGDRFPCPHCGNPILGHRSVPPTTGSGEADNG